MSTSVGITGEGKEMAAGQAPHAPAAVPDSAVCVVQGLVKTFRDFWMRPRAKAVNGVSFHIDRGEIFGLLGPNGSGKSTSIKIILGLLHQTAGRVAVFGKHPTDVGVKKRIGYLPEESYLYPFLNARETLDYYGRLFQLDYKVRQRRIDELLDMVGLAAVQHRAVREYSKGMQRRIGIAQALINDPEFLILDEPTTGLDPVGTKQIKDLIITLGRRGKSILLSSHLLADVEDCVDRMVILYGGKIQREGTCEQLLSAQHGTVIQTDDLDDKTISEIDGLIRTRSAGERSIVRVSRPRQRLEDLFMEIVDQARREKLETSGATHGGETAAFLKGDEGQALIDRLSADQPAPVAPLAPATPATPAGPDKDLIGDLLKAAKADAEPLPLTTTSPGPGSAPAPRPAPASPSPARPVPAQNVDLGVIGSLLGDGGDNAGKHGDGGAGRAGGAKS